MKCCIHLTLSGEAYRVDAVTGRESPETVHLCDWPDQHPERFVNAPRWLLRRIGAGLAVRPEHDCIGCPAYKATEAY